MSVAIQTAADPALPPAETRLPGLLVIGAMKASTTAFYELLTRRDDVWMPSEKEPHYFTSPDYGGPAALEKYTSLFRDAPAGALLGEASTGYTKLPDLGPTPQRIRETLGEPRLIYLLRDPVDRIVSNYRHSMTAGFYRPDLSIAEAVECDPILVTASRYAQQIKAYWQEFGQDALLILTTNELHADPRATMQRVEAFLDLPPYDGWPAQMPRANSQKALAQSVAASRVASPGVRQLVRRVLPGGVLDRLKSLLPSPKPSTEVTKADLLLLQTLVLDDLMELGTMLGDRIDAWPSVQRMRNAAEGGGR